MKLGVMQPYFLPYIGYWQLMNAVDKYVIFDDGNYIKSGWINRNRILMSGTAFMINLRIKDVSQNKFINQLNLVEENDFKNKMLTTIVHAYRKAPNFNEVYPLFEEVINYNENNLADYLTNSIKKISEYLDMTTEFFMSSEIDKNNSLKCQDKVIDICKVMDANEYYNAIGGIELYSKEEFLKNGITLKFVQTQKVEYTQFKNNFEPNLSIIDVMMFNTKDEVKELLQAYTLV